MAARVDPPATAEDDPSTASDAVSLHTIAEQADAYAQEQEDADFALALALEEQESARFARTQRSGPTEAQSTPEQEAFPPYRDDPTGVDEIDPPPYRDDPDAEPVDGEEQTTDAEAADNTRRRQNIFLRIIRKIVKAWLCYLMGSAILTIVVVVVVLIVAFVHGRKQDRDPKEAAWLASKSEDYSLNLPGLYPALDESTSALCRTSWEELASDLPCHRMILSQAWDRGNTTEAKEAGADPVYYHDAVCTRTCQRALSRLLDRSDNKCVQRTNRFDFDGYGKDGKAYFAEQSIEEGPAEASQALLARYDRLCSGPPKKYIGKTPLSCAEDLWMTWGIVDGKDEGNLNGLNTFLEQTAVKKTIPESEQTVVKLMRSGTNMTFKRTVRSRDVGPGPGETDCNDCLRDWLERKLLSFRYGEILEPGTRKPLGFADFDERMKGAAERCRMRGHYFAVWKAMGWRCDDGPCREGEDKKVQVPLSVVNVLHGYDESSPSAQPPDLSLDGVPGNKKAAVRTLLAAVKDVRCGALDLTSSDLANPLVTSAHVLSRLCTPRCLNAVDRIASLVDAAKYRYPGSHGEFATITDSIATVQTLCKSSRLPAFRYLPEAICAPGYAALNLTSLIESPPTATSASTPPLPRASILAVFRSGIASVEAWNGKYSRVLESHDSLRKLRIAESACNTCAGQMFIGKEGEWEVTVNAFLADPEVNGTEYVRVARKGWAECLGMFGVQLSDSKMKLLFERVGLGEGVGELQV